MAELPDCLRTPAPQPIYMAYDLSRLPAGGLPTFTLECGRSKVVVAEFGHDTDGLGDIVRAALALVTGTPSVDVLFDLEPGRSGLAVEPAGLNIEEEIPFRVCRVTLRDGGASFDDVGYSGKPVWTWNSTPVLDAYIRSDDFGRATLAMAEAVRAQIDDRSYRELWGHFASLEGFPLRGLRALSSALSVPEYRK